MPVYPGDPSVEFLPHSAVDAGGFAVTALRLGSHTGTHVDAPAHVRVGAGGVEALPLEALVGPAHVADLSHRGRGATIESEDLEGRLPVGGRALLRTDWDQQWGRPGYYDAFPALSPAAADPLVEAGVRLLGLETPSLNPAGELEVHRRLLDSGIIVVEGLAGLRRLPEEVFLVVLPLPLAGADGAPCRAIALPGASPSCNPTSGSLG
jgi:kynurenine formamidase